MNKKILLLIVMAFLLSVSVLADDGYWSGLGRCYGSNKWCGYGNDANPQNTVGWDLGDPVSSSVDLDNVNLTKKMEGLIVADFDYNGDNDLVFVNNGKLYAYYYSDLWRISAISDDNNYNNISLSIITLNNDFTPQDEGCKSDSEDYILVHNNTHIFVKGLVDNEFCTVYNSSILTGYGSYLNWSASKCAYESETSREYCMFKSVDLTNASDRTSNTNGRLIRMFYDWGSNSFSVGTTTKDELNNTRPNIPVYGDVDSDGLIEVVFFSNNDGDDFYGFTSYEINSYSGSAFMDKSDLDLSAWGIGGTATYTGDSVQVGDTIHTGKITINELSGGLYPSIIVSGVPTNPEGVSGTACDNQMFRYQLTAFDKWGEENYNMPVKGEYCMGYWSAGNWRCPSSCIVTGTHSSYDKWDSFSVSPNLIMSSYQWSNGFGDSFPFSANQLKIYDDEIDDIVVHNDGIGSGSFSIVDFAGNDGDLIFENGQILTVAGAGNGTIFTFDYDYLEIDLSAKYIPVEVTGDGVVDLIGYGQDVTYTFLSNVNNTQSGTGNNPPHYFYTNFDTCSPVCVNNNITFSPNVADDENNLLSFGVDCDGDETVDFWSEDFYTSSTVQCNFTTVGTRTVNFYLTDNFHNGEYQTDSLDISVYSTGNCYTSGQYDAECTLATISSNISEDVNSLGINVSAFEDETDLDGYKSTKYDWGTCGDWNSATRPFCPTWNIFKGGLTAVFTSFWTYFGLALMLLLILAVYSVVRK